MICTAYLSSPIPGFSTGSASSFWFRSLPEFSFNNLICFWEIFLGGQLSMNSADVDVKINIL